MIDLFEEYGYDYFEDYSLIKEVEGGRAACEQGHK